VSAAPVPARYFTFFLLKKSMFYYIKTENRGLKLAPLTLLIILFKKVKIYYTTKINIYKNIIIKYRKNNKLFKFFDKKFTFFLIFI